MYLSRHEFHKLCIDPWLVEHRTCPMCKLNILKELGVVSICIVAVAQVFTFVVVVVLYEAKGKYKQDDLLTVLFPIYK